MSVPLIFSLVMEKIKTLVNPGSGTAVRFFTFAVFFAI